MKKYFFAAVTILLAFDVAVPIHANADCFSQHMAMDSLRKDDIDPVCKMKVKAGITRTHIHHKTVYGFCSDGCKKSFVKQPEKYLKR